MITDSLVAPVRVGGSQFVSGAYDAIVGLAFCGVLGRKPRLADEIDLTPTLPSIISTGSLASGYPK
jgi:hypothetical protein